MPIFGRRVLLQIGRTGTTGKSFEGIRVTFDVKMSKASTPNEAVLEAYNLAPDTIALTQSEDCVVRLLVGYDVPQMIFQGNPVLSGCRSEKRGPDRVLHLELKDGGRAYADARVNVSFSTSTTLEQVFNAVAAQMGLPIGATRFDGSFVFPKGIALVGPAREVLERLATASASTFFIRDGAVVFIGLGEDTGEQAVVFSATAGNLIGSPSPKDNGAIEVKALMAPTLRPGKKFSVESENTNGLYVAETVAFRGDAGWSQEFYVIATGTPVG